MESTQLRNIQNIQNSLSLLKIKIENMARINYQKEETLNRLILSSIPVIEKKNKEQELRERTQIKKSLEESRNKELKKKYEESRLINEKQAARSKELLSIMKQHNSLHLKESTRQNELKIRCIKQNHLAQKKKQRARIKQKEEESQSRIQQFRVQKQRDLKERRLNQSKQNEQKIQNLMEKLKEFAVRENIMQNKIRCSEESISKLKGVIRNVQKMPLKDFQTLKSNVMTSVDSKANTRSVSEAFLVYAAQRATLS